MKNVKIKGLTRTALFSSPFFMRTSTVAFGLMLNLVLAGCSTGNPATGAGSSFRDNPITRFLGVAPSPVTSEYLQTLGGGYSARILDRRIADVMRIEGAKGTVGRLAARLPSPVALLARLRYGSGKP